MRQNIECKMDTQSTKQGILAGAKETLEMQETQGVTVTVSQAKKGFESCNLW